MHRGYTEEASRQLDGETLPPHVEGVSRVRTPWAVHCKQHGLVYLTEEEYSRQLMMPDYTWVCPLDGKVAHFSSTNFDTFGEDGD